MVGLLSGRFPGFDGVSRLVPLIVLKRRFPVFSMVGGLSGLFSGFDGVSLQVPLIVLKRRFPVFYG